MMTGETALTLKQALKMFYPAGAGIATITVLLNAPAPQTVSVGYTVANGSASAGSDFQASSGTLTFAPGVTSQTFSVPIVSTPKPCASRSSTRNRTASADGPGVCAPSSRRLT